MHTMEMDAPRGLDVPVQVSDDGSAILVLTGEPWDLHSNPDGTGGQSKPFPSSIIATLPLRSTTFSTTTAALGTGWLLKVSITACPLLCKKRVKHSSRLLFVRLKIVPHITRWT